MTWTKNNLAHADTYLALRVLDQTKRKFKTAGDQKMKALAFFDAANATLSEQKARGLASQMDNVFRVFFDAKYEHGSLRLKASTDSRARCPTRTQPYESSPMSRTPVMRSSENRVWCSLWIGRLALLAAGG